MAAFFADLRFRLFALRRASAALLFFLTTLHLHHE
jgi:hypothetical protein